MIAVFSGTGNSLWVARRLAAATGDTLYILPLGHDVPAPQAARRVIWVFPVYSWGVPPAVYAIIKDIDIEGADRCEHFAVMTCGDDAGYADRMWTRMIERRGWRAAGAWTVQMPNTYVLMKGFDVDPADVAAAKLRDAAPRTDAVAAAILGRKPGDKPAADVLRGRFARIKTGVIYPWFVRHAMSPRPFHSLDSCVGCGLCASTCPMGNINMDGRRPRWADRCALCLRCYHICPSHAVAYARATDGKGQWRGLITAVAEAAGSKIKKFS